VGNHVTRSLAYQQRTLRAAMIDAGYDLPWEAAVHIVAQLVGDGHEIAPVTPEAIDAYHRARWTDQAAADVTRDPRGVRLVPRRDPHLCWRIHPGTGKACQLPDGHDLPQAGD
jgi:hypothetical protein